VISFQRDQPWRFHDVRGRLLTAGETTFLHRGLDVSKTRATCGTVREWVLGAKWDSQKAPRVLKAPVFIIIQSTTSQKILKATIGFNWKLSCSSLCIESRASFAISCLASLESVRVGLSDERFPILDHLLTLFAACVVEQATSSLQELTSETGARLLEGITG